MLEGGKKSLLNFHLCWNLSEACLNNKAEQIRQNFILKKTSGWQEMNSLLDWKGLILKHTSLSPLNKPVLFKLILFCLLGNMWGSHSVSTSSSRKKPQESKEVCSFGMNFSCTMTERSELTKACKEPKEGWLASLDFRYTIQGWEREKRTNIQS